MFSWFSLNDRSSLSRSSPRARSSLALPTMGAKGCGQTLEQRPGFLIKGVGICVSAEKLN